MPPYLAFIGIGMGAVLFASPAVLSDAPAGVASWFVPYRSPARCRGRTAGCRHRCGSSVRWSWCCSSPRSCVRSDNASPAGRCSPAVLVSLAALDEWVSHQTTEMSTGSRARHRRHRVLRRVLRTRRQRPPPPLPVVAVVALVAGGAVRRRRCRRCSRRAPDRPGGQQLLRAARPRRPRLVAGDAGVGGPAAPSRRDPSDQRARGVDRGQLDVDLPLAHAGARVRVLHRRRSEQPRPVRDPVGRVRRADRGDGRRRPPARVTRHRSPQRVRETAVRPDPRPRSRARPRRRSTDLVPPVHRGVRPTDTVGAPAVRGRGLGRCRAACTDRRRRYRRGRSRGDGQERRRVATRQRRRRGRGHGDRIRHGRGSPPLSSTETRRQLDPTRSSRR